MFLMVYFEIGFMRKVRFKCFFRIVVFKFREILIVRLIFMWGNCLFSDWMKFGN